MPLQTSGWACTAARSSRPTQSSGCSARLEHENRQLEQELAKVRFVVEVQAKLHALVETISESEQPERGSTL
jgi:transposase